MLTLEYKILKKLYAAPSVSHTALMHSVSPKRIRDISAVLLGLRDVGWISGALTSGSSVSLTKLGRLEYLRAKQQRLSQFTDSLRYVITTLVSVVAAFFAGAAVFSV